MSFLEFLAVIIVVVWIVLFFFVHFANPLIHLLLVFAVLVFAYRFITGRSASA